MSSITSYRLRPSKPKVSPGATATCELKGPPSTCRRKHPYPVSALQNPRSASTRLDSCTPNTPQCSRTARTWEQPLVVSIRRRPHPTSLQRYPRKFHARARSHLTSTRAQTKTALFCTPFAIALFATTLLALLIVLTIPHPAFASVTAYVASAGEQQTDYDNLNPSGTPAQSTPITVVVDGTKLQAICAEHEATTPVVSTQLASLGSVTNNDMRRVMYYGYGGPEDQGYSFVRTATALSAAHGHMVTSLAWNMVYDLRSLPAPPDHFIVTLWSTGATQSICTWKMETLYGGITVQKLDRESGTNPQGNASLAGIAFEIISNNAFDVVVGGTTYTQGQVIDVLPMITDASGCAATAPDALPLGSYTVHEVEPGGSMRNTATDVTITLEEQDQLHKVEMTDDVKRGDIRLVKEVPTSIDNKEQDSSSVVVKGVQFHIINDSEFAVVSPETGILVEAGQTVCTITTDENGFASTRAGTLINGWETPTSWTGALPYGSYLIHETIPEDVMQHYQQLYGITMLPVEDWKATITEDAQYDIPFMVQNSIPQTPLCIVKVDASTGNIIERDCSFRLFRIEADGTENLVTYTSRNTESGEPETMDTWTLHAGKVTLPMKLGEGDYVLRECKAPDGYVLDNSGITFTVNEYRTWDNPITVTYENTPILGSIEIVKTDTQNNAPVIGAKYAVQAKTDIVGGDGTTYASAGEVVVAGIATNEEGVAVANNLHLGSYVIYEIKAPAGYALDSTEYTVELQAENPDSPKVTIRTNTQNAPTTLVIHKSSSVDDTPLAGVVFRIWQDDETTAENKDAEDGSQDAPTEQNAPAEPSEQDDQTSELAGIDNQSNIGLFDQTYTTDDNGCIQIPYLKFGHYHLAEVKPAPGYYDDGSAACDFIVNDQGYIGLEEASAIFGPELTVTLQNKPIEIHTTALDGTTQTHEGFAGKTAHIIDEVACTGLVAGEEYTLVGTLMDTATGEPYLVAGKSISEETTFTAQDVTDTAKVDFVFDGTELADTNIVVFEELYHEGQQVAEHASLDNADQTVAYSAPPSSPRAPTVRTGDELAGNLGLLAIAVALGGTIAVCTAVMARRKSR